MALTGSETLYVLGQNPTGVPAAATFQTTTGEIAALAEAFDTTDLTLTALTTVGAGTITAAGIVGGATLRGGSQSATPFTDTTATAALIIAALPSWAQVGQAFYYTYINNTDAVATITGGSSVTVSGITTVQPNMVARFLVTYATSSTVTVAGIDTALYNPAGVMQLGGGAVVNGGAVFNENSADVDFRVESNGNASAVFVDAGNDRVGIFTAAPTVPLDVTGASLFTGAVTQTGGVLTNDGGAVFNEAGAAVNFRVESDGNANAILVDGTNNRVGILNASPAVALDVTGAITASTTITGATVAGIGTTQTVVTSGAVTANATTTYANVTGLSQTVVAGTYKFRCVLPSTVASGTGGIKYCFAYTTAVLSSIESTATGFTAAAVAVQHTTTTTTQTDLFTQAEVVILTIIEGTFVVGTGGTVAVQMAQNTSNASDTVALVGGTFQLQRTA